MESFYKNWLLKNREENQLAQQLNNLNIAEVKEDIVPQNNNPNVNATNENNIMTAQGNTSSDVINVNPPNEVSQIVYENNDMELYIEKAAHLRQKKFDLQDHLFHMKIKLKRPHSNPPLLRDILIFLQEGFRHVLENVRSFYNSNDHNIAFLTLFQQPMINGLNTGTSSCLTKHFKLRTYVSFLITQLSMRAFSRNILRDPYFVLYAENQNLICIILLVSTLRSKL